jgi:hypothetical protein
MTTHSEIADADHDPVRDRLYFDNVLIETTTECVSNKGPQCRTRAFFLTICQTENRQYLARE